MKRVLLVSQYFYPESFKGNDIAFELAKRGYKVDVLANIPNYPEGSYTKGYGIFKKRVETVNGVRVYRAFQTPRGKKASAIGLALNYMTSMIASTLWVLFFFVFKKKYDAIFIQQLSPMTSAVPGVLLGKLRKIPVYTWVLDIWPDSVVSTIGEKASKPILPAIQWMVDWVYRSSKKILVSSKGMFDLVNRNADYSDKLIHFPNWCDDVLAMPMLDIPELPNGYIIMMAGNVNDGIGVNAVVECVERMKEHKDVYFVFVGGGAEVDNMKKIFKEKGLDNALMLGRFPFETMPAFHAKADAMFLSLKPSKLPHLAATVPARLQTYMAAGKPVFAMIDGSAAELINEADCGFAVAAGDAEGFCNNIRDQVLAERNLYKEKGENGRKYFLDHFTKNECMNHLETILNY